MGMGKHTGVRKYDHDEILRLFDQGLTTQEVGDILGCSASLVTMVTKKHGRSAFLRRYPQSAEWDRDKILEDYQSGMTVVDLCEKHQISIGMVHILRKERGIPLRPRPVVTGEENNWYKHGLTEKHRRQGHSRAPMIRQIAAICLGYIVPLGWHIHHMDEDPTNNHPENLATFPSKSAHAKYHQQLLGYQREGLEVDATQLVLENGGMMLPIPNHPITLPHEIDRLGPHIEKLSPKPRQK
jgi:hypothetical protein